MIRGGGKHRRDKSDERASRRGTIRGRPVDEVEDVELTGDELRDESDQLDAAREFVRRGQAAQRAVDGIIEQHEHEQPEEGH